MWEWQSLKARLSIATFGICVITLWSLFLYGYQLVQQDSEKLIGEQQLATAQIAAELINDAITQQFVALESAAAQTPAELLNNPEGLQA